MIKNYLNIAIRNLRRQPQYAFINVFGLAMGMACCMLIALYVREELSYDRFLPDADRVYRMALDFRRQDVAINTAYTSRPLAPTLETDFPEVESATRLWYDPTGRMVVRYEDRIFGEDRIFFGDSTFFDVLGFPLLQGDARTALSEPFSIILTESMARKYFGEGDPMGAVLQLREPSDRDVFAYRITGIMADVPANSHLDFGFLASYTTQRQSQSQSWLGFGVYTYVKLREGASPAAFEAKLPDLFATYGGPQLVENYGTSLAEFEEAGNHYRYFVQPLTSIHLHSNVEDEVKPTSDIRLIYLFAAIAVFVLILAGINFVNLATARAARRNVEVGVRKTLGSGRKQLVVQFLTEAVLTSFLGLALAGALIYAILPYFNTITGKALQLGLEEARFLIPLLIFTGLSVGVLAGAYPALYLSSFKPAAVLKGGRGAGRGSRLRDALVVFQFGIATALIICTAVVYSQMRYMTSIDLGFDAEQVVVLEGAEVMGPQAETFRETLRGFPGVVSVSNAEQVPGRYLNGSSFKVAGAPDRDAVVLEYTYASYDFAETLGLEIVDGRSLSREYPTDSLAVILNESAAQHLGLESPIGQRLEWPGNSTYTIIGVVKDFHVASLHRSIGPMALLGPDPRNTNRPNLLAVARIQAEAWPETVGAIEAAWRDFAPGAPFIYAFLDDSFEQLYETERRSSRLITLFALLAISIACIGLFGLAAFVAVQRTKEIGVRKVFGASEGGIVALLSKDFAKLVIAGIALAVPPAFFLMNRWLESFAYAVDLKALVFIAAGGLALIIALLTVSYQAFSAARINPIDALRHE